VLCRSCRRQITRGVTTCGFCGRPLPGAAPPFELVLAEGTRVPLSDELTIGRGPGNSIRIDEPTVSRQHARIRPAAGGYEIEDAGSSYGTLVDGRRLTAPAPLADGTLISLGDVDVRIERRRSEDEAGRTIVVSAGSVLDVSATGSERLVEVGTSYGFRPRLRAGLVLKRLEASEGDRRYVLNDTETGGFVRMDEDDAALLQLLGLGGTLQELLVESERRHGRGGSGRLARLLADLGDRGLLLGVDGGGKVEAASGRLARLLRPRERVLPNVGEAFERIYRSGGFVLFTKPVQALLAAIAVIGLAAFVYLVVHRYGTPFVVARHVGLGGLVFILGRSLVVAFHELAHGLTVVSFGRRVRRAGVKLLLIFPYAFVDTSEAWFEPRRRRIAISIAGPASDLVVGGAFSCIAAVLPAGTIRAIVFQVAFAAYVGAIFNLNPLLDRDGYHILVDVIGQPGLRRRSRERLTAVLAGRPKPAADSRGLWLYAAVALAWSAGAIAFAIGLSLRYYDILVGVVGHKEVVWAVLAVSYSVMFVPIAVVLARPLAERWRERSAGAVSGHS
jgi:putative peptide zinc metalloprotease protein